MVVGIITDLFVREDTVSWYAHVIPFRASQHVHFGAVSYGGPFRSKLNKSFSLLIELFVLAVFYLTIYIYIVTFCRAFFSLPSMNFWHILQIIFFYNVRIIFGTLSE